MTFLALVLALVFGQVRPFSQQQAVESGFARWCRRVAGFYDDGTQANGRIAWLLVVVGGGVVTLLVYLLLLRIHFLFAFAFSAGVLYLILRFRIDERLFIDVQSALAEDDADEAARRLEVWDGQDHSGASSGEVARLAVEQAMLTAHRGVFGVVFWFVVLPGPVGAVMYRLARQMREQARFCEDQVPEPALFACKAWEMVDAIPARLTAVAFSVLGSFEDAVACWRTQALLWPDRAAGVVLAAGAGALGVRLGMPMQQGGQWINRPELGLGVPADVEQMPRVARLLWRVPVLFLLVLALLTIVGGVGR